MVSILEGYIIINTLLGAFVGFISFASENPGSRTVIQGLGLGVVGFQLLSLLPTITFVTSMDYVEPLAIVLTYAMGDAVVWGGALMFLKG